MTTPTDTPNGEVRYTVKELTQKMLEGENELVMKYLKTLPKEECKETRARLIKNLEEIQKKKKNGTLPRRQRNEGSPSSTPVANVSQSPHGSVGKSSSKKRTKRKHIEASEKDALSSYAVEEDLDKTPFGMVYKGLHTDTGVVVAIKQVDKELVDKDKLPALLKEAEFLLSLNHGNLVRTNDFTESKKFIYFIFEFVARGSLLKMIQTYGNFPENICAVCVNQTLEALNYLHTKGFRHGNVRCSNLLINNLGVVKLSGLGSVKNEDLIKDCNIQDEPFWLAPEEVDSVIKRAIASDIWSLGCAAIEMLTGEPPYSSLGNNQVLNKITEDEHPPLPSNISQELNKFFVSCCFVKDSKRRSTTRDLLIHPWMKLYESIRKENKTYSEIVAVIKKSNPTKKMKEDDLENLIQELTKERDLLKAQNQDLKEKISAAQQKKKL